jgi:catechol 2,3-dioxygenase-like lactoylglutathione lyase family enzyme
VKRLALLVACVLFTANAWGGEPRIRAVAAIGMTVSDAERSRDFYARVLGFTPVGDVEVSGEAYETLRDVFPLRMRVVRLRLGDELLELTEYLAPRGRPAPTDAQSNDRWFQHVAIVVRDMDQAYARLHAERVAHVSSEPQRLPDWNPNAGGIRAFYFRDPDGHPLELIWFPPGKGDPRWQEPTDRLFLGIDHTAIAVGDTARSLAFYRDRLGLRVVGGSENSGLEQERLNAVRGARLRITSLRAAEGPGIEFLEYLTPRSGRGFPADARASDLMHWQTRLVARDAEALEGVDGREPVAIPGSALGFARAVTMRDPDGHTVEVVQP